jgi:hypothetical protein
MKSKAPTRVAIGIGFVLGATAVLAYHWLRLTGHA